MTAIRSVLKPWAAAPLVCFVLAAGADTKEPRLEMFGDQPSPRGLWKMELLEASDKELMANAKAISGMAVCMDAALEMGKKVKPSESTCTQAVLKNTRAAAEIEMQCPDSGTTVMTMTRESKDTILFETVEKGKAGVVTSTMKGRYHYAGECSADDSLMKLDKDSEACQRMRAETAAMSPEAVCGQLEGTQKAECVRRVESSLAKTRELCE
jgi:hypothetical protein